MNIAGLVGALLPVFFVLALGYIAGKRNSFDADQAAGLSKLAVTFALPAALFVGMTDIPRDLLLQQGRLVLALILAHAGLFITAWLLLSRLNRYRGTPAILYALMLSTSATPVFGLAVLEPILGSTSAGAVGLVALAINLTVPPAVVLLEVDAAAKQRNTAEIGLQQTAVRTGLRSGSAAVGLLEVDAAAEHRNTAMVRSHQSPVWSGLSSGLKSPLLWAPILGVAVVLAKIHLPAVVASCFELIGSATSGVAVFAVGLVLAANAVRLSADVFAGTLARVIVQSVVLFCLLHLLRVQSPFARESLVCCSFPLATVSVLFAAKYKSSQAEMASMLLFSTLALAITVPAALWLSR